MNKVIKLRKLNKLLSADGTEQKSFQDTFEVFRIQLKDLPKEKDLILFNSGFRTDFFSVIHVVRGNVSVKFNARKYEVGSESILVATPNSLKILSSHSDDCELEGVCFTMDFLKNLWKVDNIENLLSFFGDQISPYWKIDKSTGDLITGVLNKLNTRVQKIGQHRFGRELVVVAFTEFLFEIAEIGNKYANLAGLHYSRKEDLVSRFGKLAQKHHLRERKLSFYANQLHITSKHLSETVKEITGKSAGKLLDDMYISEAKTLIENRELSIAQISDHLNFSSPDIFSRFFHKMEGCSPRQYRQRIVRK